MYINQQLAFGVAYRIKKLRNGTMCIVVSQSSAPHHTSFKSLRWEAAGTSNRGGKNCRRTDDELVGENDGTADHYKRRHQSGFDSPDGAANGEMISACAGCCVSALVCACDGEDVRADIGKSNELGVGGCVCVSDGASVGI